VLERSGRDLVLACPPVIENLMGLVWSPDVKTLRYTTGTATPRGDLGLALACSRASVA